jgi:hypothetical protein
VGANGHGSEKAENGGHANHIGGGQEDLWTNSYGRVVMEEWLWKSGYGRVVMEEWLWKSGYGRVVMEEWLNDVVEVKAAQAHLYTLLSSVLQSVLLPYIVSSPPILPGFRFHWRCVSTSEISVILVGSPSTSLD